MPEMITVARSGSEERRCSMRQSPLAHLVSGAAAFCKGPRADQVRVGGVKPFDIFASKRAVRARARRQATTPARANRFVEAAIGLAFVVSAFRRSLRIEQAHGPIKTIPEAGQRPKPGGR